jgi:hypothetical protein
MQQRKIKFSDISKSKRKVAIPAQAVAALLPRYRERKAKKFAMFLMDLEVAPVSTAIFHPIFASRLAKEIAKLELKNADVITGEQLREAIKQKDVYQGIQNALSEEHESHKTIKDLHLKRTDTWATFAHLNKLFFTVATGVSAFLQYANLSSKSAELRPIRSLLTYITAIAFFSTINAFLYHASTKIDESKNKKKPEDEQKTT